MKNSLSKREQYLNGIENVCIIFSCILMLFTKFYKLAEIPYAIHVDEAGMAYDAWSLANFGVDRWLNHYPVYLNNFGRGQSALYAYLSAALVKLTGGDITILLMRLPGAIISCFAYFSALILLWKIFGKHWMTIGAFLLAIVPYFMMQSRFGLDCNLLVNMLTISVLLLQRAIEKNRTALFLIAGISWGITYYTYALSYVPNTIFLIVFLGYVLLIRRELWKKIIIFLIPVIILGLPLAVLIFINQFGLQQINLPFLSIIRINTYRGGELDFSVERAIENVEVIIKSVLWKDWMDYNAFAGYYTMYRISIPFIIIGFALLGIHFCKTIRKKEYYPEQVWWLIFVVYFLVSLGVLEPDINRTNGLFFALFIFLIWGLRGVYQFVKRFKKNIAVIVMSFLLCIYVKDAVSFLNFYFEMYPDVMYPQFLFIDTYEGVLEHLKENGLDNKTVYVDSLDVYHYLSAQTNPYDANIPETGQESYKNYYFWIPEEYQQGAVYIVRDTSHDFRQMLEQHVSAQYSDGMYICYY